MTMASGFYLAVWKTANDGTDLIIDWVNDAMKGALYTDSLTPNFSANTAIGSAPYTSNEISGTGYTAGGASLAGKTVTESPTSVIMLDANDLAWTTATFSLARGLIVHNTTLTKLMLGMTFGADYAVTAGTFTVQFASTGLGAQDLF